MATLWRLKAPDPSDVDRIARGAQVHPIVATLLVNRGLSDVGEACGFLEARRDSLHDPELLPGVAESARKLVEAVKEERPIVIYADYDVDGVCASSVLWTCLKLAGAPRLDVYIPHRVDEGYGLNMAALESIAETHPGALVVTVDCGITSVREAERAKALGLSLIITDHHTMAAELPGAEVLVHPRLPGSEYPFGELCGAGVAFKLAWQVSRHFGDGRKANDALRAFLVRAMDLVALATVADVVPLRSENRVFVRHGLNGMNDPAGGPGLRSLLQIAGFGMGRRITSQSVGFQIAPRINAAGRMERAMLAFELFTTNDPARASELAKVLDECNQRRQQVERLILEQARRQVEEQGGVANRASIVVAHAEWHSGVIGIVASRLVDEFHRPAIVIALGPALGHGSARSIAGLDLHAILGECESSLVSFGGHAAAAGLKLQPENLAEFRDRFESACREKIEPKRLSREIWIDAEVPLGLISFNLVRAIERLEPYGQGNSKPILMSSNVTIAEQPRRFGQEGEHLRILVRQGTASATLKAWRRADRWGNLVRGSACDIAFEPRIEEYNGRVEVGLNLIDLRECADGREPA
jgi:single-stranded-DNA-specific exonuclease